MAPAFEAAREYAALSGAFRPVDALPAGLPKDMVQVAAVASELAADCDPDPAGAGEGLWLMRAPARAHVLGQLRKEGRLDQAIAARTSRAIDPETDDLLAVLLDRSPFSLGEIRALLDTGQPRERLVRLVVALGRAGPDVRAAGLIDEARAVLAGIDQRARRERVEARSFVGRQEEQAQIAAWITQVAGGGPAQCLFVSGPPGIGKSSLLEKAVRSFRETGDGVVVRLDFDRAGLNTQDRLGLTMELARQVAERLPAASAGLQLARRQAGSMASFSPDAAAGRTFTPRPLVAAVAAAVGSRPVLMVLDTLEVLRRGGDERGRELFDWLDDLTRAGLSRLRVLAAGRGDALDSSPERVRERRALEGLPDKDARELLTRLDAPQAAWEDILEVSQGNPLSLRLAAEIVRRHSGTRLPRRGRDAEGLTSALLYRFLLSRIEEPALRRLAHPGLVVRRLDAEILRVVVAPRVGVHGLTQARAETLLADLASQHWLVEPDPVAPGFIRHRADMRALLLPLLYRDSPKQCARIDAAAVQWFARGSEPWRQVEAAYHRVQLMRANPGDRPVMAREIASELSDEETLRDLPPAGRDLVLELAGERTTRFRRGDAFVVPDDEGLASELAIVLRKQDWREGGEIIDRVARDGTLDPRGRAADMVRTLLWRSGRWGEARRWLRERDRLSPADEDLSSLPPEVALARLEMRAEFEPRAFVRAGAEARRTGASLRGAALESGNHLLREGAGAFLLCPPAEAVWPETPDDSPSLVRAALAGWAEPRDPRTLRRVLDDPSRSSRSWLRSAPDGQTLPTGRALAALTPYATYFVRLATRPEHASLADFARTCAPALLRHGAMLWPRRPLEQPDALSDPIGFLAAAGLFAEFAEACHFHYRGDDLRLLASGAERWRRTAAGRWSYSARRPPGWPTRELDETAEARLAGLLESADPVHEGLLQLGLWAGDTAPEASEARLAEAGEALFEQLALRFVRGADRDLEERALTVELHRRRLPGVFAPTMAVLVKHRT